MAISISILIVVIGLISLFSLPVEQYPDIAPPTLCRYLLPIQVPMPKL